MQTQTRDKLHEQYLAARKAYKSKADYVTAEPPYGPALVDIIVFFGLALGLGFLMQWQLNISVPWGFVPVGILVFAYTKLARRRGWKVYSFRSWYMQRYEPIRSQHQTAFEALLDSSVPPETLESWQHERLGGRATYPLAGYEIIYDAVEDHFRYRDADGPNRTYFGTFEQVVAFLRGRIRQAGLCNE